VNAANGQHSHSIEDGNMTHVSQVAVEGGLSYSEGCTLSS